MAIDDIIEHNIETANCEIISHLARSAAKIAYHNFKWHYITLIVLNSVITCGLSAFLQLYNKTTIITTENLIPRHGTTKQFVLFGQNLTNIIELLQWMEEHQFNTMGRFLIICQSNHGTDCDETEAVQILWDHKIGNVIFVKDNQNEGAVGYTYEFGHDCKHTPPIKVKNWSDCLRGNREHCENKFPLKFKNLYGCPIIVSTFPQDPYMIIDNGVPWGADGDLLRIIIEALNATLILRMPFRGTGWGNLNGNGTWVGSLSDLYYDLANFSMTSASITQTRYADFQMSNFYYAISLVWVTHPPEMEMSYYKLLRPFKLDTQIAMAVSFIVIVIIVLIFKTNGCRYIYKKMKFGPVPNKVLFSSWEMCMGQPISSFPSKTILSNIILLWIWYCFLMRTFYQVHLINSLKNDVYLPQLMSIEDAIIAEYPFGGGSALKDYYIENPLVYNNWEHKDSDDYYSLMVNLTAGMKFVLAMNLATTKYYLRNPNKKLHILPQTIINCPSVIFFQKFSPFVDPVNTILERLVEFGWADMTFRNSTMAKSKYIAENEDKPIKLSNFAGCYLILVGGWILSVFLLFFEIYYMKKQLRNNFSRR